MKFPPGSGNKTLSYSLSSDTSLSSFLNSFILSLCECVASGEGGSCDREKWAQPCQGLRRDDEGENSETTAPEPDPGSCLMMWASFLQSLG